MLTLKSLTKLLCGLDNPFICYLDLGGGSSPPPPDPNIGIAAQQNAEVAKDALAFNKQVYAENKPRQAQIDSLTKQVVDQQLAVGNDNQARAKDQWDRFTTLFAPVEEQMVKDATTIDSEQNQEIEAGKAAAQVSKSYQQANEQQDRQLTGMGVNPNSGRALAVRNTTGLMEAADKANAMTNARQIVKDKGIALRAGVANFGRNMPNTASNAYGLTLNAGNSASNNSAAGMNAAIAGAGQMNQGFGTSIQGNTAAGNILNTQYGNQISAWNAQQQADANSSAGFGNLIGQVGAAGIKAGWFGSSKKLKDKTGSVDDGKTLAKVKELPVDSWKYKKGVADEGEHVGPYAEDVNRNFGDRVAPGGKVIDMISMQGIQLSAIKGLAKETDKLAGQVTKLESKVAKIAAGGIKRRA